MSWNAAKLAERYTMEKLIELEAEAILKGRKSRADQLRWAITYKLAEKREQEGNSVPTCGYSGRNSKRRR